MKNNIKEPEQEAKQSKRPSEEKAAAGKNWACLDCQHKWVPTDDTTELACPECRSSSVVVTQKGPDKPNPPEDRFLKEGEQLKTKVDKTAEVYEVSAEAGGSIIFKCRCTNCQHRWEPTSLKEIVCPECGSALVTNTSGYTKPEPKVEFEAKFKPGTTVITEFGDNGRIMGVVFPFLEVEPFYLVRLPNGKEVPYKGIQLEEYPWPDIQWNQIHRKIKDAEGRESQDAKSDTDKG